MDATAIERWTLDAKLGVGELRVTAFGDLETSLREVAAKLD